MTASARLLLLLTLVCLAVAACGGSRDGERATATPATTATAGTAAGATPACADAAEVKASVAKLDQLDVPDVGKAGLQAALQDARTSLQALRTSAGAQWGGQVQELDTAIADFQTTVTGLDGNRLLGDLPTIVQNLERVDAAWTTLEREIDRSCPTP